MTHDDNPFRQSTVKLNENMPSIDGIKLAQVETRLAMFPGQATVIFYEASTDTVVMLATSPVIGALKHRPLDLCYQATVQRKDISTRGTIDAEKAAGYFRAAIQLIDVSYFEDAQEEVAIPGESVFKFSVAVTALEEHVAKAVADADAVMFTGMITVPVDAEYLATVVDIASIQNKVATMIGKEIVQGEAGKIVMASRMARDADNNGSIH